MGNGQSVLFKTRVPYSTRATVHLLIIGAGWLRTSIDAYNKEILFMVIMNLSWTYNIVSVGYICPRNVSQCSATQCMCYKDIQMEEVTFKRKKDELSSSEIQKVSVLTFIYGLPGLAIYV